jgi:antitoxin CptB
MLDRYEALLECPDADLFDWISGRSAPPPEHDSDVTRLLLAFRHDPREL